MTEKNTDDREVTLQERVDQALQKAYEAALVLDDPREEATAELGRVVLREFPALWPHRNPEDDSVRLPLRLVGDNWMALRLEIGRFDFREADIEILHQAIAGYYEMTRIKQSLEREYAAEISGEAAP